MVHCNGNVLCAIDVETTGVNPFEHEICQIAILPVDEDLKEVTSYPAFYLNIKPERTDNITAISLEVSGLKLVDLINKGVDPFTAEDLFTQWFEGLGLPPGKGIMPLASNWMFDRQFVQKWLGFEMFQKYFHPHYRDTQVIAIYAMDRSVAFNEPYPFNKVGLGALGQHFGETNEQAHDALQDCRQTVRIYRKQVYTHLASMRPDEVEEEVETKTE